MKLTNIKLSGLTCIACTKLIKKRIEKIPDITDVSVDLPGSALIKANRNISKDEIMKVLEGTHYKVTDIN